MDRICIWVFLVSFILLLSGSNSADEEVKQTLLTFFQRLSDGNQPTDPSFGWNSSSDPCFDHWHGVTCDLRSSIVKKVALEGLELNGTLDASSICTIQSLVVLIVQNNAIHGELQQEIGNCKQLTHFYINQNHFSGKLPTSLTNLNNLKRLFIFNNSFSGELSDLSKISGLVSFLGQFNHLTGEISKFDFSNLQDFNVSYNNFSGHVPHVTNRFGASSFYGNPGLCGKPTPNRCPQDSKLSAGEQVLMFVGYIIIGLVIVLFFILSLFKKKNTENYETVDPEKKGATERDINDNGDSFYYKTEASKSEYSAPMSTESGMISMSLIVPTNSSMKALRFEDLLKAPAELLGRGTYSSLYKVTCQDGATLAVKRIKDWEISAEDFKRRMEKIDQMKHPNVLPPLAFYCSEQEKLVIYGFQQNGSLLKLLQGIQRGQIFDWGRRIDVASTIAEGLAFMHKELYVYGIAHGNLKCSNILINKNMDPCISEYGLMVLLMDGQPMSLVGHGAIDHFKADLYNFGVILLELLTGKTAVEITGGLDLASWVHSVVREEWTVEVFDKSLIAEGASVESMVNLLQVALECVNPSPDARPTIAEVVRMIGTIKEEAERSIVSDI